MVRGMSYFYIKTQAGREEENELLAWQKERIMSSIGRHNFAVHYSSNWMQLSIASSKFSLPISISVGYI